MKRAYRLKKNEEFQHVFQRGDSVANRQFVVYQLTKQQDEIRIGLSVSKKLGNAVERNRIKRLMREILRKQLSELHQNRDVVIIARKPVSDMNYDEMQKSITHVLKVARLYRRRSRIKS